MMPPGNGWASCSAACCTTRATSCSACDPSHAIASTKTAPASTTCACASAADPVLNDAAALLDDLGATREPVKEIGHGYILEFRDPDGIALELIAPK